MNQIGIWINFWINDNSVDEIIGKIFIAGKITFAFLLNSFLVDHANITRLILFGIPVVSFIATVGFLVYGGR